MKNDIVSFKGMGDGVRIRIDSTAEINDILNELERKITDSKGFFGDGNCNIDFFGRKFSDTEKEQLKLAAQTLLPQGRVTFESPKQRESNDWLMQNRVQDEDSNGTHPAEPIIEKVENEGSRIVTEEEVFSVFRSNRARLYQGVVREGQTIRSDGHLILFGKAEQGSSLIAVGNILVIGGLYGNAHAGCNGHDGSYILAMDMRPQSLAVAKLYEEYTYSEPEEQIQTESEEKHSFFEKFKKKNEETEKIGKKHEETEISAVALCKNNKIELDNFTIKIFTNSKNMV